jgi:hypothetical protein
MIFSWHKNSDALCSSDLLTLETCESSNWQQDALGQWRSWMCWWLQERAGGVDTLRQDSLRHLECKGFGAAIALRLSIVSLSSLRSSAQQLAARREATEALRNSTSMVAVTSPRLLALLSGAEEAGCAVAPNGNSSSSMLARLLAPQRARLRPADGVLRPSTRLGLANGQLMPLLGLGTGFGNCFGGRNWEGTAKLGPDGGLDKEWRLTSACDKQPEAAFYARVLRETSIRMVDTARTQVIASQAHRRRMMRESRP